MDAHGRGHTGRHRGRASDAGHADAVRDLAWKRHELVQRAQEFVQMNGKFACRTKGVICVATAKGLCLFVFFETGSQS